MLKGWGRLAQRVSRYQHTPVNQCEGQGKDYCIMVALGPGCNGFTTKAGSGKGGTPEIQNNSTHKGGRIPIRKGLQCVVQTRWR